MVLGKMTRMLGLRGGPTGTFGEKLEGKPFTRRLLVKADQALAEDYPQLKTQAFKAIRLRPPSDFRGRVTNAAMSVSMLMVCYTLESIGRADEFAIPDASMLPKDAFVAPCFGFFILMEFQSTLAREGYDVVNDKLYDAFGEVFLQHTDSQKDVKSIRDRAYKAMKALGTTDNPDVALWRRTVRRLARDYVLQDDAAEQKAFLELMVPHLEKIFNIAL